MMHSVADYTPVRMEVEGALTSPPPFVSITAASLLGADQAPISEIQARTHDTVEVELLFISLEPCLFL